MKKPVYQLANGLFIEDVQPLRVKISYFALALYCCNGILV